MGLNTEKKKHDKNVTFTQHIDFKFSWKTDIDIYISMFIHIYNKNYDNDGITNEKCTNITWKWLDDK